MKVLDVVGCTRCPTNNVKIRNTYINHVFEVMCYSCIQRNAVKPVIKETRAVLKMWNREDSSLMYEHEMKPACNGKI
jgi:hypothetical protein